MAYLQLDQYNRIIKIFNPIFYISVILFFLKEFSILFSWDLFVEYIPDFVFLIVFFVYAVFYIGPMFRHDWVEGYELPTFDEEEEEEEELTDEEKELKELEKISL